MNINYITKHIMKKIIVLLVFFVLNIANSQNFTDTKGKLQISDSGQASYTLPIAMPPSIKNFAPLINLVYSSGKSGGIAGQGWDISSISSITRIATRRDIDGISDGVDFDENDKLALEGQRLLLKSGNYWYNGSTYQTEFKSNLKIELKIEGSTAAPSTYFIVTNVDGSRTWYGSTGNGVFQNAISVNSWYIIRSEDVYGNYITYNYTPVTYNNTTQLYISNIMFSGNEGQGIAQVNKIVFNYTDAKRIEKDYIKGLPNYATKVLDRIEVYTNSSLFRKYQLTRNTETFSGYERVTQVQEFNGAGEASNPVNFEYYSSDLTTNVTQQWHPNILNLGDAQQAGDFDGDGRLDFIANGMAYTNLFNPGYATPPIGLPFTGGKTMVVNTLDTSGKYNQFQSLLNIKKVSNTNTEFKIYNFSGSQFQNVCTKSIVLDLNIVKQPMTLTWHNTPSLQCATHYGPYGYNVYPEPVNYIEGDFDGNGISEVIIYKPATIYSAVLEEYSAFPPFNASECPIKVTTVNQPEYRILDLNPLASTTYGSAGYVPLTNNDIEIYATRYVNDFNGDGKSDILQFSGNAYQIIEIVKYPSYSYTQVIGQGIIDEYSASKQILFGDYNGDGKVDIMLPDTEGGQYNVLWHIYYSNPNPDGENFFVKESHIITEYWPTHHGDLYQDWKSYYSMDVNKDGKSDMVVVDRKYSKQNWTLNDHDTEWSVATFTNNIGVVGGSGFTPTYWSGNITSESPDLPTPVVASYRYQGANTDLIIARGNSSFIEYYKFNKNFNTDNRLKSVSEANGNIKQTIEYKEMISTGGGLGNTASDFYSSTNSAIYPDVEIIRNSGVYLVSKLTATVNGMSKFQRFRYRSFMSNFNYGDIGFQRTARSSWYLSESDTKIWTIQNNDPSLRGANNISWTNTNEATVFSPVPDHLLNTKTNSFATYTNPTTKVYNVLLTKQVTKDELTNITIEDNFTYDGTVNSANYFGLQTQDITNYYNGTMLQGSTTSETAIGDYDNNPTGTGNTYYIGKPKKIKTTKAIYGTDPDTRTSEEQYFYSGPNVTRVERKGNNTDPIIEENTYDPLGNLLTKTVSVPTSVPAVASRTIIDEYDPATKRFVTKKTDLQGFVTLLEYNSMGQVKKSTAYLGDANASNLDVINEFNYDNWGKMTQSKLTNKSVTPIITNTTYSKFSNGSYTVTSQNTSDNSMSLIRYDVLGREITAMKKGFASATYISIAKEYDGLGRLFRESEPYFVSPNKWARTYQYDYLHRPVQITQSSTRVQTLSYSGLTSTVVDDGRTKTTTVDAMGNKIQTTDPGGTIAYGYYATGELKKTNFEGHEVKIGIDGWGNKISMSDPNVGTLTSPGIYSYTYDGFAQLTKETTPKGYTGYTYDGVGKILTKTVSGDGADFNTVYTYNTFNQLTNETSKTAANVFIDSYDYTYDALHRLYVTTENNANLEHTKTIAFTTYGRIDTETNYTKEKLSGTAFSSNVISKYVYNSYNGILYKITDQNNATLWQLNKTNEKMQTLNAALGNGINITNQYSPDFYVASQKHVKNTTNVLYNTYDFNAVKGTLRNRQNYVSRINEDFTYDDLDRLVTWTNPLTPGTPDYNVYDNKGRITANNKIGQVNYNTDLNTGIYKKTNVKLNQSGIPYYSALGGTQTVTYTMFKSPVSINESNKGKIDFEYNSHLSRSKMNYDYGLMPSGGTKVQRKSKLYSDDGSTEIIFDNAANTIKIRTFVGGDAYGAVLYNDKTIDRNTNVVTETKYYLHRDYLGSILAITDVNGAAVETRHFDAWGNLSQIVNAGGVNQDVANGLQFFDRGYTGHEHLQEVRLIHMNGRLYDPVLRSFLMPDNFIQDPGNTQNYNRYSYVLNNPLSYTDPSGEEAIGLGIAVIIAVAVAVTSYTMNALLRDVPFSGDGLLQTAVISAASAVVTFGIGSAADCLFGIATTFSKAAFQAVAHGVFQGALSSAQGGNFWSAAAAGAISSIAASAWGADLNGKAPGLGWAENVRTSDVGMIAFGTVAGGGASVIGGGNFWEGAAIGLTVGLLNHAAHNMTEKKSFRARFHNVDPDAKPVQSMSSVNAVIGDVDGLSEYYNSQAVGAPPIDLVANDGDAGHYDPKTHRMQLTKNAFKSNYHLARTIFHESYHSWQYHWNGGSDYKSIISKYGSAFYRDVRTGYETPSFKEFELRAYKFIRSLGDTDMYNEAEIIRRSR